MNLYLITFLAGAIMISLSGVAAPGPVTAVTVAKGQKDPKAGVLISLGHGVVEFPLMAAIFLGFGNLLTIPRVKTILGLLGGMVLIFMGYGLVRIQSRVTLKERDLPCSSFTAGILTTAANPYFFIWWATIGAALLSKSLAFGTTGLLLFAILHWFCDLGWNSLISFSIHRTQRLWSSRVNSLIILVCGIFLLGFGSWFIYSSLKEVKF